MYHAKLDSGRTNAKLIYQLLEILGHRRMDENPKNLDQKTWTCGKEIVNNIAGENQRRELEVTDCGKNMDSTDLVII